MQKGGTYEVIVFDDASVRTGDAPLSDRYDDRVRVLRAEKPVGAAQARNRLAECARGRILLYLDDDAFMCEKNTITRAYSAFEDHPEAGILAFQVVDHVDGDVHQRVPFSWWRIWRGGEIVKKTNPVSTFLGGGYAIRQIVVEKTGGYEPFFHYMGEEQDLAFKTLEEGYTIQYVPRVSIAHKPGPPIENRAGEKSRLFYSVRNRIYLARRYIPTRYLPSYLLYWLSVYAGQAVTVNDKRGYVRGLYAGFSHWGDWTRAPLSASTQQYLRRYGRHLWF